MIRIFLPPEDISPETVNITGDQARHLVLVLRAKPSDMITVLDGKGYKYECRILSVHKRGVSAEVLNREPYSTESPVWITLAQGIAKGDRMDLIIQKSTELGVRKIVPVITERSQVKRTNKTERWRKIGISAAQQSGRDKVPDIDEPVTMEEYLSLQITSSAKGYIEDIKGVNLGPSANIILSEEYKMRKLKAVLKGLKAPIHITLLVGPEGGFSKEEVRAAVEKGFIEVSLGPRILRTETAPITAISIIQYELGDMG
jgi:16S rRNA (uracil1498-N3)-methyltransferase